jgi:uncharacterized protein YyaL (SSP411 family)
MERESFEDQEVAQALNKDFVSIKVDREERPDIDSIYMTVCQSLTGHGGWPMTIVMTPDKKPFFAGTYFPKHDRMGLPGLMSVLERTSEAWREHRDDVLETSGEIVSILAASQQTSIINSKGRLPNPDTLAAKAYEQYKGSFDSMHGGFGNAPKFPSPHIIFFLLRYWKLYNDDAALKMAEKTLEAMRRGGIFDHIGYGFSRYSTDRLWLVPHFEKMLYDNALLALANLEAYQATANGSYARTAEEIFTYVLRDMTSPEGGFYSAEDADSEGEEGLFYTWTPEEIRDVLGSSDAERYMLLFGISDKGNFEGRNIPNTISGSIPGSDLELVENCRRKLFEVREKRVHPFKDDKILTSWNGLMIAALAYGGRVLGSTRYTSAAEKAAKFILSQLMDGSGRLLAVYRGQASPLKAYADDYAYLIWGLIELYETTYSAEYLQRALLLNDALLDVFWDEKDGGLFLYGKDSEELIIKPKESYDGAMPSANSAAAVNMIRLARLTAKHELEEKAQQILLTFAGQLEGYPVGYGHMLNAALLLKAGGSEVVITGRPENGSEDLVRVLRQTFRPFTVSLHYDPSEADNLHSLVPFVTNYSMVNGRAAAYVCRDFTCSSPVTEAGNLQELLQ